MNSTLLNILKMRTSLFDSAVRQDNGIQILSGLITDKPESQVIGTVLDGMGNGLSYTLDPTGALSISQNVKDNVQSSITLFQGTLNDWNDNIDEILTGNASGVFNNSTDIKTFLQEASKGEQSNLLLSTALDKFSTNSKCNSQDLISIIESYGIQSADKKQLKQAVAAASDNEGKISNFAFLNIIQNIANNAHDALDDNEITMDTTKVFYLTNFLATAWDAIVAVIGTVIGTLLSMVNQIIGLIVTAITWIFSTILGAINKKIPSKIVVIDPLSATDWFEGPLAANRCQVESNDAIIQGLSSDQAILYSDGAVDHCIWMSSKEKIAINRFLGCGLDLSRAASWLSNVLVVTQTVDNLDRKFTISCPTAAYWETEPHWPAECYLDSDEQIEVLNKSVDDLNDYIMSCYLLSQGLLIAHYFYKNKANLASAEINIKVLLGAQSYESLFDAAREAAKQGYGFTRHLCNYLYWYTTKNSNNLVNAGDTTLTYMANDEVTLSNQLLNASEQIYDVQLKDQDLHYFTTDQEGVEYLGLCRLRPCETDDLGRFILRRSAQSLRYTWLYYPDEYNQQTVLSSIPTDRMFRFAAYDTQDLIKAMVTIGAITAIALVAGSVIIKQVKKMSYKKQLDRKTRLVELTDNYAENPSAENYKALYKAQKSYNFKAKLFGWDTYDAGNQWFDAPEAQGNDGGLGITGADITLEDVVALIRGN